MAFSGWHVIFLVSSVIVAILGLGSSLFAVYSPAWQVVELREFRAEHQHGLWQDCVRDLVHVTSPGDVYEEAPLHCMYKFDDSAQQAIIDSIKEHDAAALEREHHLFSGWHKLLLGLIISSEFLVFIGVCTAFCVLKSQTALYVYAGIVFVGFLLSLIADGVFFIEAMRVDVRFAEGAVGTYEQQIGYAFYLHLISTAFLAITCVLIVVTICTYRKRLLGTSSNYGAEIPGPPLLEKYSSPTRPSSQAPYVREYAYHVTST